MESPDVVIEKSDESNYLRLVNMDAFLFAYELVFNGQRAPFAILADLEDQLRFKKEPQRVINYRYREDTLAVFQLTKVLDMGNARMLEYRFNAFQQDV